MYGYVDGWIFLYISGSIFMYFIFSVNLLDYCNFIINCPHPLCGCKIKYVNVSKSLLVLLNIFFFNERERELRLEYTAPTQCSHLPDSERALQDGRHELHWRSAIGQSIV